MSVEVVLEDPRWAEVDLAGLTERAAAAVSAHLGLGGREFACLGANDARIAELNAAFRGRPVPTNVLSWPAEPIAPPAPGRVPPPPSGAEIGDIALAYETCLAEAKTAGIPLSDHASHLVVHGILHLLGYDHDTDADADLMEATEIAILMSLGIANPYL